MSRIGAASVWACALVLWGCSGAASAPDVAVASPLEVALGGCARVHRARGCAPGGTLYAWVPGVAAGVAIDVSADGRPVPATRLDRPGGARLALELPQGARALELRASTGRTARIALFVPEADDEALLAARAALDAGRVEEAEASAGALRSRDGVVGARALGILGRVHLRRAERVEACALLSESARVLLAMGELSLGVFDALACTHTLGMDYRLADARAVLDELATSIADWPEGRARAAYHRGLLALRAGDVEGALRWLDEAREGGAQLGLVQVESAAIEVEGRLLFELGRGAEAERWMDDLAPRLDASDPCAMGAFELSRGAQRLIAIARRDPVADRTPAPDARTPTERALSLLESERCPRLEPRATAHAQLAQLALLEGRLDDAEARIAAARASSGAIPTTETLAAALEIEARVLAERGALDTALERWRELEQRAARAGLLSAERRALVGRAEAHARRGEEREARAALERAEVIVDDELQRVPFEAGRAAFAGHRDESARRLAELLLARGEASEALGVVRRARARAIATLALGARLSAMRPEARARVEAALATYQRARQQREEAAARAWALPLSEATSADDTAERDALSELRSALGASGARADPSPLAAGEAYLAITPGTREWLVLAEREGRATSARLAAGAAPQEVIAQALEATRASWEGASVLVLGLSSSLAELDAHAVLVGGAPLVAQVPVRYALDVSATAHASGGEGALLIVDPRGDLPSARVEGDAIAALAHGWTVLAGEAATRQAILAALPHVARLHYAGHGEVAQTGIASALPVAGDTRITSGDVITSPRTPRWVVLSACEAAGGASVVASGLGVAQAFVLAGSERVVAATRPLDDREATAVAAALWRSLGEEGASPERALAAAQLEARARGAREWSRLRVLGP